MTRAKQMAVAILSALAGNPNASVFVIGLGVLCASVAQWSVPLAGAIAGGTLMAVAVWPFVAAPRKGDN